MDASEKACVVADGKQWQGMLPSAGGCDEFVRLYCFRRKVEPAMIKELEGRLTGLRDEGEASSPKTDDFLSKNDECCTEEC